MPHQLANHHAVITGASRGFGREIALHFARAGAHLYLLARDAAALEETCALARAESADPAQTVAMLTADFHDLPSLPAVFAGLPPVDILVNNAGMQGPIGPFENQAPGAWREVFVVNFLAAAECCRLVLPGMKERGRGKIVNISGGGATSPRVDFSAYAASKAALVRFSETLAEEVRDAQIDVNCVAPGAMNTRMLSEVIAAGPDRARQEFARAVDQQEAGGTPLETGAEVVLFLASRASDGITGRLLSAVWDEWRELPARREALARTDVYTLRRIVPLDRGARLVMRVGIVGSGLIGHKRARHLAGAKLRIVCDLELGRAELLANSFAGCQATSELDEVFAVCDLVIVCTANHALCDIALRAVRAGKHVLIEKPGAIRSSDLEQLQREAAQQSVHVRVGYNHRFHPALLQARALVDTGAVGDLMFIRARYGHGGRVGYDTEWRADPALSGGGELIDQGVHLIDLAGWFLGPFTQVQGHASTFFWGMPVDDNAFLHLRTGGGATAWLHASCTEWKNLFSFELYGRTGKLHVEGLGGSYGVERLAYYKMLPEMGPPETTIWEYPRGDNSWELEFAAFLEDITLGRTPEPGLAEGIATLKIVEEIYRLSAQT